MNGNRSNRQRKAWVILAVGCEPASGESKLDDEQQRPAPDGLSPPSTTCPFFAAALVQAKSFVLHEMVEQLRQSGRRVVALAPQRQQVVEMERRDSRRPLRLPVSSLKRELAERAVVVVDEAGQIGGRQMLELMRLVRDRKAI